MSVTVTPKQIRREETTCNKNRKAQGKDGKREKRKKKTKEYDTDGESYLVAIHFKLAYDLDGHLIIFPRGILGAIDIAKGAVSHLFQ